MAFHQVKKERIPYILLYCSLFLLRIPNLYLIPFYRSSILSTQGISRILLFGVVAFVFYENRNKYKMLFTAENALVLLFLLGQSLSIISAINVNAFLMRYKDIILAISVFFAVKQMRPDYGIIGRILIMSTLFNSLYAMLVIYVPFSRGVLEYVTYDRYFNLVLSDIERGRYYATSYDEVIVPFLLSEGKFILASLVAYISLVANFRTKILSLLFVSAGYLLFVQKKFLDKYRLAFLAGIIVVTVFSAWFSIGKENFVDRLNLGESDQVETLQSRQKQIAYSFELGKKLFGVGLGNYYDYVSSKDKSGRSVLSKNERTLIAEVNDGIHNNFASVLAECGYVTLAIYAAGIVYFLLTDIPRMQRPGVPHKKLFILSFWGLFIYGLFNPGVALSYQFQYWLFRGLISNENID